MIEIKHRQTGEILLVVHGDTLQGADLSYANLSHANLINTNLSYTRLVGADMTFADLTSANLSHANLNLANLIGADLADADLTHAGFGNTNLSSANLSLANLNGSGMWGTKILECDTLHLARGLEDVMHGGASSLDVYTLRASIQHLPDVFLRGVGYNDEEIDVLRGLYGKAFRFYSCFISYARANNDFADRLFSDLQANGVTCWKDTEHMRGGDYYQSQITKAINLHDKVILICSQESLTKPAVISEIVDAKKLQDKSGVLKLFPIRLDNFIFSDELKEIGKKETAEGNWPENWLAKVNAFYIPDFGQWKDHDAYQIAFQSLLNSLKAA